MQHKQYKTILNTLVSSADIEHGFIISRDGLLIYPESCTSMNANAFSAMSATLLGAGEAAVDELGGGIPTHVTVNTKNATIIGMGASPQMLLAVVTAAKDIAPIINAMKTAADKIKNL
jgi:predicted regulator of Ras-like GTPase activity (Roadblock/LC7/MglB family)